MSTEAPRARDPGPEVRRTVLFAVGAVVAAGVLVTAVFVLRHLLLLAFASVLIAAVIRAAGEPLARATGLKERHAILIAALVLVGVLGVAIWLFGRRVAEQAMELASVLPGAWAQLWSEARRFPWAAEVLSHWDAATFAAEALNHVALVAGQIQGLLVGAFQFGVHLLLVPVAGLYLALEPRRYRDGALLLLPRRFREGWRRALDASGRALRHWLVGQLVVMVIVGVLTGLGAWMIGLPAPLALGVLAGLAEFVPFVGPVAASVPALLLAATLGRETFLITLALYVAVQQLESYVFTPLVQRRMVMLPPVLTLFAVLAMAALLGPLGLILSTPLAVVLFVWVKSLYIRDVLDEDTPVPGDPQTDRQDE